MIKFTNMIFVFSTNLVSFSWIQLNIQNTVPVASHSSVVFHNQLISFGGCHFMDGNQIFDQNFTVVELSCPMPIQTITISEQGDFALVSWTDLYDKLFNRCYIIQVFDNDKWSTVYTGSAKSFKLEMTEYNENTLYQIRVLGYNESSKLDSSTWTGKSINNQVINQQSTITFKSTGLPKRNPTLTVTQINSKIKISYIELVRSEWTTDIDCHYSFEVSTTLPNAKKRKISESKKTVLLGRFNRFKTIAAEICDSPVEKSFLVDVDEFIDRQKEIYVYENKLKRGRDKWDDFGTFSCEFRVIAHNKVGEVKFDDDFEGVFLYLNSNGVEGDRNVEKDVSVVGNAPVDAVEQVTGQDDEIVQEETSARIDEPMLDIIVEGNETVVSTNEPLLDFIHEVNETVAEHVLEIEKVAQSNEPLVEDNQAFESSQVGEVASGPFESSPLSVHEYKTDSRPSSAKRRVSKRKSASESPNFQHGIST